MTENLKSPPGFTDAACLLIGLALGMAFGILVHNLGVGIGVGVAMGVAANMSRRWNNPHWLFWLASFFPSWS